MAEKSRGSLGVLAAPSVAPRLPEEEQAPLYKRLRGQAFLGIFLGYAGYYLIRNNVSIVSAVLEEHNVLDALGLGIVANAVLFSYGLSKFFMAMLSDRANARYFLPLGLALSAIVNLLLAFVPILTASVGIFATMMFINGWFQGMGWPPSGRVLVHWFSTNERGWMTSIWNCAHNVGGAGVGILSAWALSEFASNEADWTPAFWVPAIVALVVAVIAFILIRDRPEAVGLPPIEEWREDPAKVDETAEELEMPWKDKLFKHVLTNRVIVLLALTNVFVYTLRYGVLNWIPIYLTNQIHAANITDGIIGFAIYELAGIVGTLLCGWMSDKVFKGWRSGAGLVFILGVGIALVFYWQIPASAPLWIFYVLIAIIGGLIYGPVMLIGLMAIDMSPTNIAGTAAGFTGLFGYLLGASLASTGVGLLVKHFGWDVTFACLVGVVLLALVFMWVLGRDERKMMIEREEKLRDMVEDTK
ncbi:MFS transporter [Flaviflexus massiliensis]|uniref:MFS transporter n=1 Tax=Flaviflexus massiliensis TaxID=1522309 RepID=UPI0006D53246|nr:MFS transporter [Flaviflexus massiliensis]